MSHSTNYEIDKQLRTLILNTANNNPAPMLGTVASVSDDGKYIDVNLQRGGTLSSIKMFNGNPERGKEVILVFIDGDINQPRAFVEDYPIHKPYYNLLPNGNFSKTTNNQFNNWTGGNIVDEFYYGNKGCMLESGQTLTSDFIDITSINNEDAFTVSFVWYHEGFSLEVYDQDNTLICALPSVLGTQQKTAYVDKWSFQRYNYNIRGVTQIKIKFTNNSENNSYIDGVRVWNPDNYQEWFPYKTDEI